MATLTVRDPGWNRYSGQRSRVPPARSARTGARTMTFFMWVGLRLLEKCPPFRREGGQLLRWSGELRREVGDAASERGQRCAAERVRRDRLHLQRIEPRTVVGDAVVEMRTGGQAGHADVADHLALRHFAAGFDALRETGEV